MLIKLLNNMAFAPYNPLQGCFILHAYDPAQRRECFGQGHQTFEDPPVIFRAVVIKDQKHPTRICAFFYDNVAYDTQLIVVYYPDKYIKKPVNPVGNKKAFLYPDEFIRRFYHVISQS